ncbi:MAG: 5-formyltetrahydrofolate cyclo-ligase [Thermodesulfovibrionaceae bacterium]
MLKLELRKKMLDIRKSIPFLLRKKKEIKIFEGVIELVKTYSAKSILLYASYNDEVDTWRIFDYCINNSIKTAFPKVDKNKRELKIYWINKKEDLVPGYKGILEPKNNNSAKIEDIDLLLVPGVVFDERCFRIGYGGGFYDKLLRNKRSLAVGLAYEEQIVKSIPEEAHDIRVDLVITDKRTISCV